MIFDDSDGDIKIQYENIIEELNILNIRIRELETLKYGIISLKKTEYRVRDNDGTESIIWVQPKNNANNDMDDAYRIGEKSDLIINIDKLKIDNSALTYYTQQSTPEESMPE